MRLWLLLIRLPVKVKTRISRWRLSASLWLSDRLLITQISRFVVVGALTTVGTFLLYQLLILALPYWLAFTLSYAAGIAFSFAMNSAVVFKVEMALVGAIRYVFVYLASYGLSLVLLIMAIEWLGMSEVWAPIPVIAIMAVVNFTAVRMVLTRV